MPEYVVHEGRPSWHQQRAGHISAASTGGFKTREEAEEFQLNLARYHPNLHTFIVERKPHA